MFTFLAHNDNLAKATKGNQAEVVNDIIPVQTFCPQALRSSQGFPLGEQDTSKTRSLEITGGVFL